MKLMPKSCHKPFNSAYVLVVATALAGCGGSKGGKKKVDTANQETQQVEKPDKELLMMAGSDMSSSQKAYDHCAVILAKDYYDTYKENLSDDVVRAARQSLCQMTESDLSQAIYDFNNQQQSNSSGRSGSAGLSVGVGAWSIGGSGSQASSSQSSDAMTKEHAANEASRFRAQYCGASSSYSSQDFTHEVLSQKPNETIVKAWQACISQENHGFFCSSERSGSSILVKLQWSPNDLQRKLLPELNLSVQTAQNLTSTMKDEPSSISAAGNIVLTYKMDDDHSHAQLVVNGHDADKYVNFACKLSIPPRPLKMRHPFCGIETYKLGRGEACGVELYNSRQDPVCGIKSYNMKASPACGVKTFREGRGQVCGGEASSGELVIPNSSQKVGIEQDPSAINACRDKFSGDGRYDYRVVKGEYRNLRKVRLNSMESGFVGDLVLTCGWRTPFTCRNTAFGVEAYNTCDHPSHGVAEYKACSLEGFGAETYKECRNAAFGVELYRECEVPLPN